MNLFKFKPKVLYFSPKTAYGRNVIRGNEPEP